MPTQNITSHLRDLGGTIRTCSAAQTLEKIEPHLKTIGITRTANVTGLDNLGIPVAVCMRPGSKHLSVSQGKGISWELAKVSAIMESIEGYHVENPKPHDLFGSYSQLCQQYTLADPSLFLGNYLRTNDISEYKMGWIACTELISRRTYYLPHILICLDSSQPHPEYALLEVSSNGLASGNELSEAICHGLFEVIERDALWHWGVQTFEQQQMTNMDINTIDCPLSRPLIKQLNSAGLQVCIWDVTSKLGIPTYRCAICNQDLLRSIGSFHGSGTHLSKSVALARAITEAAQSRLTLISGSRDDVFPSHYTERHLDNLTASSKAYPEGKLDYQERIQTPLNTKPEDDLQSIISSLQQHGYNQVFMHEHTKLEFNIPVTQVFVPGLKFSGERSCHVIDN